MLRQVERWVFGLLVFVVWAGLCSLAEASPAYMVKGSWRVACTGLTSFTSTFTPFPYSANETCTYVCQNFTGPTGYAAGAIGTYIARPTNSAFTQTSATGPGLSTASKFYGHCICDWADGTRNVVSSNPTSFTGCNSTGYITADAECKESGESLVSSFAPASCNGTATGTNTSSACYSTLGQTVSKMVQIATASSGTPSGCYMGCRYGPPASSSTVSVDGLFYRTGLFVGQGIGCAPADGPLLDSAGVSAEAAGLATEATQAENKGLLQDILAALTGTGGGSSGGTNTGGDLDRSADASEAIKDAVTATDATLEQEGKDVLAQGAASTANEAGLHASLPQSTVNFGGALSGVTVSLFGAGSCPQPAYMFDWNGQPVNFNYSLICQYLSYLGVLVSMAGAFLGFRIALS